MNRQLSALLLLFCLLVVLVQSKTSIEVDEYGNEYEVKRFHVQGRQLNSSPQCVVTRRKRATEQGKQYNVDLTLTPSDESYPVAGEDMQAEGEDENEEDVEDTQDIIKVEDEDEVKEENEKEVVKPSAQSDEIKNSTNVDKQKEDMHMMMEASSENDQKVPLMNSENDSQKLTLISQETGIKNKVQKITLLVPQKMQKVPEETPNYAAVAQQTVQILPSSLFSQAAGNHFVVVQRPQTSAAAQAAGVLGVLPAKTDYTDNRDTAVPFTWEYSTNPVTTTAVWSTGEDVNNSAFNKVNDEYPEEYSEEYPEEYPDDSEILEVATQKPARPVKRPSKTPVKKMPNRHKIVRKYRRPNRKIIGVNPDRRQSTRNPVRTSNRKSSNKRKNKVPKRRQQITRTTVRPSKISRRPTQAKKRKANKRNQNASAGHQKQKKVVKKPHHGGGAVTTTETMTTTDSGNDADIDCIIINKDIVKTTSTSTTTTTTTTRRPFWNILGRNVRNRESTREFGNRKRVNLRFIN